MSDLLNELIRQKNWDELDLHLQQSWWRWLGMGRHECRGALHRACYFGKSFGSFELFEIQILKLYFILAIDF